MKQNEMQLPKQILLFVTSRLHFFLDQISSLSTLICKRKVLHAFHCTTVKLLI
jgi:hypothetical protein